MTKETDYLVQSLFEKESLEEMTLDEFRRIADQYPYSSIVQFLYSCKLKSVYHLDFPEQVTHTALFFSSPQWLHYQLSDESEQGNFRLNQYDKNFNNISEDIPGEVQETVYVDEEDEQHVAYPQEEISPSSNDTTETAAEDNAHIEILPEVEPEETVVVPIEPYHTVDYFASQGIKTTIQDSTDDLGIKVRTFTAWLKTLKRLQPATEISEIEDNDEEIDSGYEQATAQEIIATEAMAEVYLKQGLAQKAIEVYAKLSLQNPANSHIFAAKIIKIKENHI